MTLTYPPVIVADEARRAISSNELAFALLKHRNGDAGVLPLAELYSGEEAGFVSAFEYGSNQYFIVRTNTHSDLTTVSLLD